MQKKRCTRCKIEKPLKDFHREKRRPDGLRVYCKSCMAIIRREQYVKNRRARIESTQRWRDSHYDYFLSENRRRRSDLRNKILDGYGAICKCCGETIREFLTIEHPNRDGKEHRKKHKGIAMYKELIRRNFPPPYFLLCWNCNCSQRWGNPCPHVSQAEGKGE